MLKRYLLLGTIGLLFSCTSSTQEPWKEIFNGVDTAGWEIRDGIAEAWVENGVLMTEQVDSLHFPYLAYKEEVSDYIMECEMKLTGPLNSGILVRGVSDPSLFNGRIHGFQMEIDQSERQWTGGIYEESGRLWLTPLKDMGVGEKEAFAAYKASDWNHYRIEAIADTFKIWVNRVPTTHLIDSKTAKGIIGFQIHKIAPDEEKGILRIKNVRILTEAPEKYSKPISLPAKRAE
ncbi:MAG: DUF1080 domain-containing protein [Cyclobacteriaceae bacterium]